jgi:hypothetical protein
MTDFHEHYLDHLGLLKELRISPLTAHCVQFAAMQLVNSIEKALVLTSEDWDEFS